ncbi:fibronectin type III domain-containing protein 7-like, partial [Centroberyx affinis]|uniref:fibronectin type III domain-containing protein 7-like n=1 Tax=Centroberyx affinis TaxID=166261 RepID=UPI003A5C4AF2
MKKVLLSSSSLSSDITVSVFSATSRTMLLRWTRFSGASSYKITVSPKSTPTSPIAFAHFGPNTVLGSVASLSPNTQYIFMVEALDNDQVLSSATIEATTAPELMGQIERVKPRDSRSLIVEFGQTTGVANYIVRIQNADGLFAEQTVSSSPALIESLTPYTDYTVSVLATSNAGRSQPSIPVEAKTVLPPIELTASSPSNDSIVVSWAPVANAVRYSVAFYKLGSSGKDVLNTTGTSLTLPDLDAGSLYIINGYAWDAEGREGEAGPYINQTTRPPTPASVNVSVVLDNEVAGLSVSWDLGQDVHGVLQYLVTSDQNLRCNSTSSPCTLSPVGCGETHTIQVTATNEAGPGSPSSPVVFTTFPCPPESLAVAESDPENCTLTWNAVAHADKYMAFIKRDDGAEETCNTTGSGCTYRCRCGYTYLMSVFAFNGAGSSPPGPVLNYTTLPCCPVNVSISLVSTDTLEITWAGGRGAELYETRAADDSSVILCNDTAPVCALSDLSCDSKYSVVVTPCNDIRGCNRACPAHKKYTAPCTPTDLTVSQKNATCITVSWTAANTVASYTVSAVGEGGTHTCTTLQNSCDITDLPCGSAYEVSAIAVNLLSVSLPSFSVSLET